MELIHALYSFIVSKVHGPLRPRLCLIRHHLYQSSDHKGVLAIGLPLLWFRNRSHLIHVYKSGSTVWLLPLSNVYTFLGRSTTSSCKHQKRFWALHPLQTLWMTGRWDPDWKHPHNVILYLLWRQLRLLCLTSCCFDWLHTFNLQFLLCTIFYFTIQLLH